MKFLPTDEQLRVAIETSAHELDTIEKAEELEPMEQYASVIKLYNAAQMGINRGMRADRQWRYALILALRAGWYLREQTTEAMEVFQGIDEGEIERMLREIQAEGTGA